MDELRPPNRNMDRDDLVAGPAAAKPVRNGPTGRPSGIPQRRC